MNNFKEEYQEVIKNLVETFRIKNERYGDSFTQTLDEYGMVASIVRVSDKFNRMETLFKNPKLDPNDESMIDTMTDMANYLIMTVAYMKSTEGAKSNQ
ncbi:DUF1599 domain-containing protein [Peptoniphilus sp. MSJ-1]|uniref:DUF1599 domain-containing protein n=1 Tax=Peptoniphilus ovalis TaxID=2841503 RepID=A0ABS6FI36_9FIRM|nr:nucleotide modification associated domain-containing protein [Peptoniphilus ovalis]MBU5669641.1 DUF1599 domain-containing protein [Peptoniphilus ovalis]